MLKQIKLIFASVLTFSAILYGSFIQPQLHNNYLRWEVGESVVQVLAPQGGGGTGFAVQAASGAYYIMTNKHVCEAAPNGWMIIKQANGDKIFKRIIYRDNIHDLCLIEGDKRLSPLSIGSVPDAGDFHYVVGHPGLRPLTVSAGEFVGDSKVELLDEVNKREECKGEVYELSPFERAMYGLEFACIRSYKTYATTAVTYPGNSGSPAVNRYGNVIGVLFAGNTQQERDNHLVPLVQIKRVLSKF